MNKINKFTFRDRDTQFFIDTLTKEFIEITNKQSLDSDDYERIESIHADLNEIGYKDHIKYLADRIKLYLDTMRNANDVREMEINNKAVMRSAYILKRIMPNQEFDTFCETNNFAVR